MTLAIRSAVPSDLSTLLNFVRELAEFERAASSVLATEELLGAALFGKDKTASAVIAEIDGTPVGFAVYFQTFSTWTGRPGLYLEDLYVEPQARRTGIGAALLRHLASVAMERGCARLEWAVLDWNEPAINFYINEGAEQMSEWRTFRVSGQSLARMARS